MEYGYTVLMAAFSVALLLYAGLMALFRDYRMLPLQARVSVEPKDKKRYMLRLAKIVALVAASPALSALIGLWNIPVAFVVLLVSAVLFIWLGTRIKE
ncbi:MAG: hypothetical protein II101_03540 [Ruminococcus sp.]|nr:hypothetical protein [Ruminococcus sp.]